MTDVVIILVRYREPLTTSAGFESAVKCLNKSGLSPAEHLVIYDNSQCPERAPVSCSYYHNPRNPGLAAAYNYALRVAKEWKRSWILLLDQDSTLPEDYLERLPLKVDSSVAAIVPRVISNRRIVSPVRVIAGVPFPSMPVRTGGIRSSPTLAINSGALLRVSFLEAIGGFNEEFPLDSLDHWWSYELFSRGHSMLVLDCRIEHRLSVSEPEHLTVERYTGIVESEVRLFRRYRALLSRILFGMVLIRRAVRFCLIAERRRFAKATLRGVRNLWLG